MQEDSARLFTALWPDPAVRACLGSARDAWRWPAGARPVPDDKLHLTLHFIGAFPRRRLAELAAALATCSTEPAALRAEDPELWPGGIAVLRFAPQPALTTLHGCIGTALTGFGVALDPRPFAPHVTLARRAASARPPRAAVDVAWPLSGFALVESSRGPRAGYQVLRSFAAAHGSSAPLSS